MSELSEQEISDAAREIAIEAVRGIDFTSVRELLGTEGYEELPLGQVQDILSLARNARVTL